MQKFSTIIGQRVVVKKFELKKKFEVVFERLGVIESYTIA